MTGKNIAQTDGYCKENFENSKKIVRAIDITASQKNNPSPKNNANCHLTYYEALLLSLYIYSQKRAETSINSALIN